MNPYSIYQGRNRVCGVVCADITTTLSYFGKGSRFIELIDLETTAPISEQAKFSQLANPHVSARIERRLARRIVR